MHYYLFLNMIHILGEVLFLRNNIVTGFWKALADFSKDWRVIAFSQRLESITID